MAKLYIDDLPHTAATAAVTETQAQTSPNISLGGYYYGGFNPTFNGALKEVRLSGIQRSDNWVKATNHSLFDTLVSYISVDDDSDHDGITDFEETNIYCTDPHLADTDGDGIDDGDELAYWGVNWNNDYDGDGLNNLLDADADNDHFSDGDEIDQGYDPSDAGSTPWSATVSDDLNLGLGIDEQQGGGGLVGDLVRILNGNIIESRTDVAFSSPHSLGFKLESYYNNRSIVLGSQGYGWSHTFESFFVTGIQIDSQNTIRVMDETGRAHFFADNGTSSFPGLLNEKSHMQYEAGEYVWHRLDGSRSGFSPSGKLSWIEDQKANRLTLGYDSQGSLETVTDSASGRMMTFHYLDGLLDRVTGPITEAVSDGIWITFGYDAHQNLTSVTYADGTGFTYSYTDPNDNHNLTEKRNAANHLLGSWSYDSQDRCSTQSNPDGTDVSVAYVSASQVNVTDAYGTIRTYTISEISGQRRVTARQGLAAAPYDGNNLVRWQYDTQLNLVEIETAGGTIHQYQNYDARGNPGTVILAAGQPEERTLTYTFHPEMNVPLTRSEPSVLGSGDKITIWDYDDDYDATANENPVNLPSRVIERGFTKDASDATVSYEYATTLTYNSKGQVESIDGSLAGPSDTTQFAYATTTGNLLSITRPLIGSTNFANYDAAGQVGRLTDVNSQSENISYDGRGRITGVTHESDASIRSVSYNTAGPPEITTDEDGVTKSYEYDTSGRLYRVYDTDDNYIEHVYDAQGNLKERHTYNTGGTRTARKRWSYQHPTFPGKLWSEIKAGTSDEINIDLYDLYAYYDYDSEGNVASVTDFNNNITAYEYDSFNRLITVSQPGGIFTSYEYDAHGNLESVRDAKNHETVYIYDDQGRVVTTTSPDTGTETYLYDASGNLVQKTDAKNITVNYDYDALNRLTHVRFPDSSQDITYTYDAGVLGKGRRTGMTDPAGVGVFEYDNRGRLIGKDRTIAGQTYLTRRTFTPGGRLDSFTYPSGKIIDYTRYDSGRIQTVTTTYNLSEVNLVNNLSYNPFGAAKGLNTGSGGTVNNGVDYNGDLEVINSGQPMQQTYKYEPTAICCPFPRLTSRAIIRLLLTTH